MHVPTTYLSCAKRSNLTSFLFSFNVLRVLIQQQVTTTSADIGRHISTPEAANIPICATLESTVFVVGILVLSELLVI